MNALQTEKLKELLVEIYQKANGGASLEEVMQLMKSELNLTQGS
ncbi:hypothetical protein [Paraliobacillus sediminis]|nr:hypothetical protein [Paraliobacillus sediminis]